jgi:hypothetical protein
LLRAFNESLLWKANTEPRKGVGAGLRDDADDRTGRSTELCGELIRNQPDLLHEVGVVDGQETVVRIRIVRVLPIDNPAVRPQAHAIHGEARPVLAGKLRLPAGKLADAGRGQCDREHVAAAAHGQLGNPSLVEPHTYFGVRRVQKRRIGAHLDRLRHLRRTDDDVDDGGLIEHEMDPRPQICREAIQLGLQFVAADGTARNR